MADMRHTPWILPLVMAAAVASAPGCFNGDDGGGGPPASTLEEAKLVAALSTANVIALHDEREASYDADCVSCHGVKTDEVALDGVTPKAHAVMMPFAVGATPNDKCTWCHGAIRMEFRNPTQNVHMDTYADYADPVPAATSGDQLRTVRLDTNHYEGGAIRHHYNPVLCLTCHGRGSVAKTFYDK